MLFEQLLFVRNLFLGVDPNLPGEAPRLPPDPKVLTTLFSALSNGDRKGEKLMRDRFCSGHASSLPLLASLLAYLDWLVRFTK